MKQIFFKKEYMDLILADKKTSTIRLFTTVKEGEVVHFVSGKHWLKVKIVSVQKIPAASLTDTIAQTDGFKTKHELLKVLTKLYPNALIKDVHYIIFTKNY